MRANLLLLSAGVLALGSVLPAQTPTPVIELPAGLDPADLPPEVRARLEQMQGQGPQGVQPAAANAAQDPAKAAAEQKAQKRLQAFKKLVFDRRPSSILKAWAQPELKPYDPKEDEKDKAKAGAADGSGAAGSPDGAPVPGGTAAGGKSTAANLNTLLQPSSGAVKITRTGAGATLSAPAPSVSGSARTW